MSAVTDWINANAQPISLDPRAPLADLTGLDALVSGAHVVGLGESTRAGHEIIGVAHRVLRYLVERHGFRALIIHDDRSVIAELDEYVRSGEGDSAALLENAWNPWRTTETIEVVEWIRRYNHQHPADPVRLVGLDAPAARLAHYDLVAAHVERAGGRVAELREHFAVIRTAHRVNEHVQRAHGTHPGRPFAAHAHDAAAILAELPRVPQDVRAAMETIVAFHAHSIAAGSTPGDTFDDAGQRIIDYHTRTGHKALYWEGIAMTSRGWDLHLNATNDRISSVGARLHDHYGRGYVSVAIGFDHGEIHAGQRVPPPDPDLADAVFAAAGPENYVLNLHAAHDETVARWLAGQHRHRIIAGVYKPSEDSRHFLSGGPLNQWCDAVIRVAEITPTTLLEYSSAS